MKKKKVVKTRKKKPLATCKYCSQFIKAKRLSIEVDEDSRLSSFRKCPITLKSVGEEDVSCEKFELNKVFWCRKWEQWMNVSACFARRKRKEEGCVKCSQGTLLETINGKI
jgi:hypothetical protein